MNQDHILPVQAALNSINQTLRDIDASLELIGRHFSMELEAAMPITPPVIINPATHTLDGKPR